MKTERSKMTTHPQPIPTARLLLAGLLCLLAVLARAETANEAWAQRYDGPGNGNDSANAVAVDSNNDVIVTGGSETGPDTYLYDFVTIKYSGAGVPLWTNRYDGPGNGDDYPRAIALDSSNNVIVAGYSTGSGSSRDYLTIQYSSAGVPLWTNRYNGPGNGLDEVYAVAVDGSNNVVVTGYSVGSGTSRDYATIQYSSAGVPLWTNRYDGPGNFDDFAKAIAVDGSNNVIVTGSAYGSQNDYATIKYSSAGVPLWTNRYNGPGNSFDEASTVAVDGANNVIVAGQSVGSAGSFDYATLQYSSAGVPLWTNRYNGPGNGHDQANAVAVDSGNNVIVTGYSDAGTSYDYLTIQYSSAGVPLWTNRYNGSANSYDQANTVAVDGGNNVIVTGYATESGSFYDYATIKYSSAGVPLWTNRYNGPANRDDIASALAVDGANNVIVTGHWTGSGGYLGFATVKYEIVSSAPSLSVVRTTTNTVAVSWPSLSADWALQQNTNSVTSVNWSNVTAMIQDDGTTKTLIVNPPTGNRFYRLNKP